MSNIGFRVRATFNRPDRSLVDAFADIPVANIADNMNRMSCISAKIRPLNAAPLLGTAFTVKVNPGDNLMLHKAIDMAEPGDVIVVDAQGSLDNAITGELMVAWMEYRKIAGLIVDGAIRDVGTIQKMAFPVYAAGATPKGPYKNGPGEINQEICCGGVVINPGDILVGDEDGVVVICPEDAAALAAKARETIAKEAVFMDEIKSGRWDRSWVDKTLAAKGCTLTD